MDKEQWIKPELIIICESEVNENLLGSAPCPDINGDGQPDCF